MLSNYPIITIDGPSASGKGTLASRLANLLGFHYLDSGLLYRMVAYQAQVKQTGPNQISDLVAIATGLNVTFLDQKQIFDESDLSGQIRSEQIGLLASQIAAHSAVREALLLVQRSYSHCPPGLVSDGRDMGTVVFPMATLKIFVTADVHVRAARRLKQLESLGKSDLSFDDIMKGLVMRDQRDVHRLIAPLSKAEGAKVLDTSEMTAESALKKILDWCYAERRIIFNLKNNPI